jgi:hypothetical protein
MDGTVVSFFHRICEPESSLKPAKIVHLSLDGCQRVKTVASVLHIALVVRKDVKVYVEALQRTSF